jgi:hypothetical protein
MFFLILKVVSVTNFAVFFLLTNVFDTVSTVSYYQKMLSRNHLRLIENLVLPMFIYSLEIETRNLGNLYKY